MNRSLLALLLTVALLFPPPVFGQTPPTDSTAPPPATKKLPLTSEPPTSQKTPPTEPKGDLEGSNALPAQKIQRLSLVEALETMLKNNPALSRERLMIQQALADLTRAKGVFTFDLNLDLNLEHANEPRGIQNFFSGGQAENVEVFREGWTWTGSVGLAKRFSLGTVLSFNFQNRWSDAETLFVSPSTGNALQRVRVAAVTNSVTLQVTQPLLRGAWFPTNLAPIWQAEENVRKVRDQVAGLVLQYVGQTIRSYWDLVYARAKVESSRRGLSLAKEQLRTTDALIQAGKKSDLERFEVEQVIARRRGEILQDRDRITEAETQLRVLLYLPVGIQILPTEEPEPMIRDVPSFDDCVKAAEAQNPILSAARRDLKIANWSVVTAKNGTLPQLDLAAGFTFLGLGNQTSTVTPSTPPLNRSFEMLFDPRTHNFQIGLVFRVPLDNRQAQGALERSQIETHRAQLQIDFLRRQLYHQLRQLYEFMQRSGKRIPIARVSLNFAQKKLEAEQTRYRLGQSTLFTVLQYQQDLIEAEIAIIAARVDLQKAIVTLFERIGTLLQRHRVVQQESPRLEDSK